MELCSKRNQAGRSTEPWLIIFGKLGDAALETLTDFVFATECREDDPNLNRF